MAPARRRLPRRSPRRGARRVLLTRWAAAGLLLVFVVGCGSGAGGDDASPRARVNPMLSTPTADSRDVVVARTGIGIQEPNRPAGTQLAYAVAFLENTTDALMTVTPTFQARDRLGAPIGEPRSGETVMLRGRQSAAVGRLLSLPGGSTARDVGVELRVRGDAQVRDPLAARPLTVAEREISIVRSQSVGAASQNTIVTGTVRNPGLPAQPLAQVTAVCFDGAGGINGGGDTLTERLPIDVVVPFAIDMVVTSEPPVRCEPYAVLSARQD